MNLGLWKCRQDQKIPQATIFWEIEILDYEKISININLFEFQIGRQIISLIVIYLIFTIYLSGIEFLNLMMPFKTIVAEAIFNVRGQELFESIPFILVIDLFNLSMKSSICVNIMPIPKDGRQDPVVLISSRRHSTRHWEVNGSCWINLWYLKSYWVMSTVLLVDDPAGHSYSLTMYSNWVVQRRQLVLYSMLVGQRIGLMIWGNPMVT